MKHYIIKTVDGNRYELHGQSPVLMRFMGMDVISFSTNEGTFKYINTSCISAITIWEDEE